MTTYTVAGRRLVIHDREEWVGSQPVTGPSPSPSLVHHFVVHWPGNPDGWKPDTNVPAHLRAGHAAYLRDKGFSYGYGFVIGPNPIDWNADPVRTDIWEVRGFDIRIASNDGDNGWYGTVKNPNFNGRSISAQIMASTNYPATNDQIEQMRYLVAIADQIYGETLTVIPHRTSDATTCPGEYLTSKIPLIATRPTVVTPPPQEDDLTPEQDAMLRAVYNTVVKPAPAPAPTPAPPPSSYPTPTGTPPIRWGDTNATTVVPGVANEGRVSWLQVVLESIPATGVYDALTVARVKAWQTAFGIAADGVYGSQTEAALKNYRGK